MSTEWTNEAAIRRWGAMPREAIERLGPEGDLAKRHLLNPVLLRLLGDVRGRRVLDAGCGHGYLSRMLAGRGALVTGVEPARSLFAYAVEREAARPQGIRYVQADLSRLPPPGEAFDRCVCSMVLPVIPEWEAALRSCVEVLAPGGTLVVAVNHPCFERLLATWREHGHYRVAEYLDEYEIAGPNGSDRHRTISTYLNALVGLGCRLVEVAEPRLDPAVAAAGPEGIEAYVHLPNFLVVAVTRT